MGRRLRSLDGRTAENGLYIAGNRHHRIERDGRSVIIGPGDPFPEAGTLPPRRLRLLLDRGDVMFVPHQGVSKETVLQLVLAMTKAAKDELKASLELVTDKGLSKEAEAELVVDALLFAEARAKVEEIQAEFARQRVPKPRALPPAQSASTPRLAIPHPSEWIDAGPEELVDVFGKVAGAEQERAIKEAGLLAQVIERIQKSEKLAKKDPEAHTESFLEASIAVIKDRVFLLDEDGEPVEAEEAEAELDAADGDEDSDPETTVPPS